MLGAFFKTHKKIKKKDMKQQKLMLGNNIELLKKLPDNSIDSIVTDPPYGLSFMGKKWDYDVPTVELWKEIYRVLKPGGHILSFGGTRTYHRMVVNIEDAGFEIRDQIQWIYGSGFPKSLNVGKAVDKLEGNEREVVGEKTWINGGGNSLELRKGEKVEVKQEVTKGESDWEGWGSALKPANEPICLARKPLSEKSIAENVLKWRTGGLNIDCSRIGTEKLKGSYAGNKNTGFTISDDRTEKGKGMFAGKKETPEYVNEGRFPSNLILDDTAAEMLDEQSGISKSSKSSRLYKNNTEGRNVKNGASGFRDPESTYGDSGGASRFFYVAKVSKAERNMGLDGFEEKENPNATFGTQTDEGLLFIGRNPENRSRTMKNNHPTVKPINLMSYLCKLITPPNGIVLDPFMGSGSTGVAALLNDFRFVGMEMDADYLKLAEARINNYDDYRKFLKK